MRVGVSQTTADGGGVEVSQTTADGGGPRGVSDHS